MGHELSVISCCLWSVNNFFGDFELGPDVSNVVITPTF
jgi:hypothetical protein